MLHFGQTFHLWFHSQNYTTNPASMNWKTERGEFQIIKFRRKSSSFVPFIIVIDINPVPTWPSVYALMY